MVHERRMRLFGRHVVEMAREAEAAVLQERLHAVQTAYQRPVYILISDCAGTRDYRLFHSILKPAIRLQQVRQSYVTSAQQSRRCRLGLCVWAICIDAETS